MPTRLRLFQCPWRRWISDGIGCAGAQCNELPAFPGEGPTGIADSAEANTFAVTGTPQKECC